MAAFVGWAVPASLKRRLRSDFKSPSMFDCWLSRAHGCTAGVNLYVRKSSLDADGPYRALFLSVDYHDWKISAYEAIDILEIAQRPNTKVAAVTSCPG